MNLTIPLTVTAAAAATLALSGAASGQIVTNLLDNPSFESADASGGDVPGAPDYFTFNDVFTTASVSNTGDQSLKAFGPFVDGGGAGAVQGGFAAMEGDVFQAGAFLLNSSTDPLGENNFAVVKVEYLDAGGGVIAAFESAQANADTLPMDVWTPYTATGVAPAGTASAQFVLVHVQIDPITGGSIFADDASFGRVIPEPATVGLAAVGGLALLRRRRN